MSIHYLIQRLIDVSLSLKLIKDEDEIYIRNRLLALLNLDEFKLDVVACESHLNVDPLGEITQYAIKKGLIPDTQADKDIFESQVMDVFIPKPSVVTDEFYRLYSEAPMKATKFFYGLSKNSRYIKMNEILKNTNYKVVTEYGNIDITINLSKPEKDPKAISQLREVNSSSYPKCLLCAENVGYKGRADHPGRANHRVIPMSLLNEKWYLQYSPYVYYNEHCILFSEEHRDMQINTDTFRRLLLFVQRFPHYFIGSNADIPIVGGSILSHEHYQGGHYEFAMAKAEDDFHFTLEGFPEIQASVVKWPMSVIRLKSRDTNCLVRAASSILDNWKHYSDPAVCVIAHTGATRHNTITPIARVHGDIYELDLVLRNNRTSAEHPLGIFHPHADVHHIKKENIGLIEVMGLAVLPARLQKELLEVKKYILNEENHIAAYHVPWANALKKKNQGRIDPSHIDEIIKHEVGMVFLRVLEDAAVFKRDKKGREAFWRFIHGLS